VDPGGGESAKVNEKDCAQFGEDGESTESDAPILAPPRTKNWSGWRISMMKTPGHVSVPPGSCEYVVSHVVVPSGSL
jgi:hypothetical protein